jgi:hypothetical protein
MGLKALIRWKYHEIIWINHIAYMGGEYPKGVGDIPGAFAPLGGAIFLGYSSPGGGIPRNIALFWEGGESPGGGDKSPVTTAWANSHTFLKILSCPPPKYEFAPQMPPPPPKFWGLAPPLSLANKEQEYILNDNNVYFPNRFDIFLHMANITCEIQILNLIKCGSWICNRYDQRLFLLASHFFR